MTCGLTFCRQAHRPVAAAPIQPKLALQTQRLIGSHEKPQPENPLSCVNTRPPDPVVCGLPGAQPSCLGQTFAVTTDRPGMASAMLVAPGATSHGNDMHQRAVKLAVCPAPRACWSRFPSRPAWCRPATTCCSCSTAKASRRSPGLRTSVDVPCRQTDHTFF